MSIEIQYKQPVTPLSHTKITSTRWNQFVYCVHVEDPRYKMQYRGTHYLVRLQILHTSTRWNHFFVYCVHDEVRTKFNIRCTAKFNIRCTKLIKDVQLQYRGSTHCSVRLYTLKLVLPRGGINLCTAYTLKNVSAY